MDYNLKKNDNIKKNELNYNNNNLNNQNKIKSKNYKSNIPFGVDDEPIDYSTSNNSNKPLNYKNKKSPQKIIKDPLNTLREKLKERGTRGILSI